MCVCVCVCVVTICPAYSQKHLPASAFIQLDSIMPNQLTFIIEKFITVILNDGAIDHLYIRRFIHCIPFITYCEWNTFGLKMEVVQVT